MFIQDNELMIRPMTEEDCPLLVKWLSDPEVLRYYEGRDYIATPETIAEHFDEGFEGEGSRVIIEFENQPIGYGQIYRVCEDLFDEYNYPDDGRIVYATDQFIGEPRYWNKGIGTKYLMTVSDFLKEQRHADAIILDPHKDNTRAIRCYEKAGFHIIGELPAHELFEGSYRDCLLMEKRL